MALNKPSALPSKALSANETEAWRSRLSSSRDAIKPIIEKGKRNIERLTNLALELTPKSDTVTVPLDFAYTYQKAALLFPETPEVVGDALHPDYDTAAPIYTAVANHALGTRGVNAMAMIEEISVDLLCAVGYGVTKIGYENVIDGEKAVPTGAQIPDPKAPLPMPVEQPGAILGLSQPPPPPVPMIPETVTVPNVVHEAYFWNRLPPGWFRCPNDFRGSDFDRAAWLATRFEEDVPEGEKGSSSPDEDQMLLTAPPQSTPAQAKKRGGYEVWYKASLFDADVKHPDVIRLLKIYDDGGRDQAVERQDSPTQRWAVPGQPGQPAQPLSRAYVPGASLVGMKGFPIHVFTLRYVSDRALPPSDCTMSRQIVDENSKGRTQMITRRDRGLPQIAFDGTRVTPEMRAKIERGENTGMIDFGGPLDDSMFKAIEKGQFGRENFAFADVIQKDMDVIWAMGSSAGVLKGDSPETATKSNQIQQAIQSRARKESTRIMGQFAAGVEKLMALYQIYADAEDYVRIVGKDGEARLSPWNKDTIAGPFALKAKPNPQAHLDAASRTQQLLQGYNLLRKDPNVEPRELVKPLAAHFGYDPERLWKESQPPPAPPPNVSYAIKVEDFAGPAALVAVRLAASHGIVITPQELQAIGTIGALYAAQQMQQEQAAAQAKAGQNGTQPHGGAAPKMEPIDKHQAALTGGTQGMPSPGSAVM